MWRKSYLLRSWADVGPSRDERRRKTGQGNRNQLRPVFTEGNVGSSQIAIIPKLCSYSENVLFPTVLFAWHKRQLLLVLLFGRCLIQIAVTGLDPTEGSLHAYTNRSPDCLFEAAGTWPRIARPPTAPILMSRQERRSPDAPCSDPVFWITRVRDCQCQLRTDANLTVHQSAMSLPNTKNSKHSANSAFRKKLVKHILVGELLKRSWRKGNCSIEISKPEVGRAGCDLIAECNGHVRHIQLKASIRGSRTSRQTVNLLLAEKPSGCVVWVHFDPESLELGPFLSFGGNPGQNLPPLDSHKTAPDAQGVDVRPNLKDVSGHRGLRTMPRTAGVELAFVGATGRYHRKLHGFVAGNISRESALLP